MQSIRNLKNNDKQPGRTYAVLLEPVTGYVNIQTKFRRGINIYSNICIIR